MSGYVLALHAGHNSAALIGDQSGVLYAVQEERFTREKNYWGFPKLSVRACLDYVGAKPSDLHCIAYGGNQVISRYHSRDDVILAYKRQDTVVGRLRQRVAMPLVRSLAPEFRQRTLRNQLDEAGLAAVPVHHHDHHLAHALTAYYGLRKNPRDRYLVLTCDGSGDAQCASVRVCGGGEVQELATTHWDNSLGALYAWVTYAMGFVPLEHEYKIMGMAPYASPEVAREMAKIFENYLKLSDDGLRFEHQIGSRTNDLSDQIFADLKGKRFDHIAAGLQYFTEELLGNWVRAAVKQTGIHKVLASGGVFMNVKANKRIAELAEVESFEAFPSCGDETLTFGAFWAESAQRWGHDKVPPLGHFYWGDDLDPVATQQAVETCGFTWEKPDDLPAAVAELLVAGQPVARCSGRMEFGARALGNRSILADPRNSDVTRVINHMIKERDFWMPFAPIVLAERQHDYLHNPKNLESPFMMMTFDAKENHRDLIAALHNADLTCRAQILRREQNEEVHGILKAFEARTGRGVLLNTSFNLHGYPIVRNASDAIDVFRKSGLEHLQVGPYLLHKNPAPITVG